MKKCRIYIIVFFVLLSLSVTGCFHEKDDSIDTLVSSYPFDGNANDVSGNENHGVVNGATLTTDRLGNDDSAFSFDGTTSSIEVSVESSSVLNLSNQLTLEAWINISEYYDGRLFPILSKGMQTPRYSFMAANDGSFYVVLDNTIIALNDNNVMDLDTWYHVAITWDGSTVMYYKNGILVSTFSYSGSLTLVPDEPLLIGYDPHQATEYANGKIDNVKIWNSVRTGEQIKNSM